jgi:hypothetical protein
LKLFTNEKAKDIDFFFDSKKKNLMTRPFEHTISKFIKDQSLTVDHIVATLKDSFPEFIMIGGNTK